MKTLQEYLNESLYNEDINENFIWDKIKQFWNWLTSEEDLAEYEDKELSDFKINKLEFNIKSFNRIARSNNKIKQLGNQLKKNTDLSKLGILQVIEDDTPIITYVFNMDPIDSSDFNIGTDWSINIIALHSIVKNIDDQNILMKSFKTIRKFIKKKDIDSILISDNDLVSNKTFINTLGLKNKYVVGKENKNKYYYVKL